MAPAASSDAPTPRRKRPRQAEATLSFDQVMARLHALANPANVEGMARFGISSKDTLGISVNTLRELAKEIGKDHALALQLWDSGIHEARILATIIDDPRQVTEAQMEQWASQFDSWDICDGACYGLFDKTPYAWKKAKEWSARREEFVRRGGFALMASLAVHNKKAPDQQFLDLLPLIQQAAGDNRNYVRKAVNWALRQIGKRNATLNAEAIATARHLQGMDSRAARWIAADALRELTSPKVQQRLAGAM
ncbi:MAG: DNA alkylation repair protein [Chloroflexi bacterium]|nr:DNA alkylation repair protein [Chloroflexota bacterium]